MPRSTCGDARAWRHETAPSPPRAHRSVSTSAGAPTRDLAHERAQPRDERRQTSSGDGSVASSSDPCTMRPGMTSSSSSTTSIAAGGRMRFEIEQDERAQHARVAHRRRQIERRARASRASPAAAASSRRPRRDRRARASPTTRSHSRASTNASGSSPSIGHSSSSRSTKPRRPRRPARAARHLRRRPPDAAARRAARAARAHRRAAARQIAERPQPPSLEAWPAAPRRDVQGFGASPGGPGALAAGVPVRAPCDSLTGAPADRACRRSGRSRHSGRSPASRAERRERDGLLSRRHDRDARPRMRQQPRRRRSCRRWRRARRGPARPRGAGLRARCRPAAQSHALSPARVEDDRRVAMRLHARRAGARDDSSAPARGVTDRRPEQEIAA